MQQLPNLVAPKFKQHFILRWMCGRKSFTLVRACTPEATYHREFKRGRERLKMTWAERVRMDMKQLDLHESEIMTPLKVVKLGLINGLITLPWEVIQLCSKLTRIAKG